jgi:hypothetical protein
MNCDCAIGRGHQALRRAVGSSVLWSVLISLSFTTYTKSSHGVHRAMSCVDGSLCVVCVVPAGILRSVFFRMMFTALPSSSHEEM